MHYVILSVPLEKNPLGTSQKKGMCFLYMALCLDNIGLVGL